jgi:organic hydroperoxide reductase OsmC/OhrA
MKALYTAEATTGGRNGHVKSNNNVLDVQVRIPKALGGINDEYTNPEMLFAAGYAACFECFELS